MLYFIPTPIGNLEDISRRGAKLLLTLPTIFCEDTRVTRRLIALLRERYPEYPSPPQKFISMHSHNEKSVVESLEPIDFAHTDAAYASDAGMPCISDPGAVLVQWAQTNGVPYEVLPGANAALLALAASGFEGTKFYFHGFLPHKKEARERELKELLAMNCSVILYESTHRIAQLAQELAKLADEREIYLIKEATKKHETHFRGCAREIAQTLAKANLSGEWALVIKPSQESAAAGSLNADDLLAADIPPKTKAKLLAKLTNTSVKEWYEKLMS
jgi:16S rRNA (cytidine1402-2'-O)-methyltransferase